MVLTIPLGRRRTVYVALRRNGVSFEVWRAACDDVPSWGLGGDEDEGGAGVREPRVPRPPSHGGAIALEPPDLF